MDRDRRAGRLDRLPWSCWHWLAVVALGIIWVLDGLEVTLAGSVAGVPKDKASLGFTDAEVGLTAAVCLAGAVLGALLFGYLTDRLGRKKLFTVTLTRWLWGGLRGDGGTDDGGVGVTPGAIL